MTIIFFLMSKTLTNSPLKISRKKINCTSTIPGKCVRFHCVMSQAGASGRSGDPSSH